MAHIYKLNKGETAERLSKIREELGDFAFDTDIIPFSVQNNNDALRLREIIESAII